MSISLSKWPILPTMPDCCIRPMCSGGDDVLFAGALMKIGSPGQKSSSVNNLRSVQRPARADRVDSVTTTRAPLTAQRLGEALPTFAYPQ